MTEPILTPKTICQIGLVVHDINKSAAAYSKLFGLPVPETIITDEYEKAKTAYHGLPTSARAKLAFFHLGPIDIELIEPVGGPSTWKEALDTKGECVHHIAFQVEDTQKVVTSLEAMGAPLDQQGHYTGGMYTYIASEPVLGVVLELLQNLPE